MTRQRFFLSKNSRQHLSQELPSRQRFSRRAGLTLLEITLVLGMMATIFSLVWGLMSLYSRHYLLGEKRMARSQLVRSISELLAGDLAAAVQDPIHPAGTGSAEWTQIRRFGLRGDAHSLAIDVVEPNLFADRATVEENLAHAVEGGKPSRAQVPELKTVFYEFVPINARQTDETPESGSGGSQLIGSLQTPGLDTSPKQEAPLVRKFGLSRRELDFETPEEEEETQNSDAGKDDFGTDGSGIIGSLAEVPQSAQAVSQSENNELLAGLTVEDTVDHRLPLTASQIGMEIEDGTMWAPEVVECQFRYFDGRRWYSEWNSIERGGLPTAIEAVIGLMTLDDVEVLRSSPYRERIVFEPDKTAQNVGAVIGTLSTARPEEQQTPILLADALAALQLSPVMVRRLVTYLPTTPLAQHQMAERRHPVPNQPGKVSAKRTGGSGKKTVTAKKGRASGERIVQERQVKERTAVNRRPNERTADQRTGTERVVNSTIEVERKAADRNIETRRGTDREIVGRSVVERDITPRTTDFAPPEDPAADAAFGSIGGDTAGPAPGIEPDTAFDSIDSLMSGFTPTGNTGVPGQVPSTTGPALPTVTSRTAAGEKAPAQTWIRGKNH